MTAELPPSSDLVSTLNERVSLVSTLANPNITLARAAAAYIMFKRRRLTPASERGYQTILDELTKNHPGARLADFEPPKGSMLIEDFLVARWGHLSERTYNKAVSVFTDLFNWHVARGTLQRNPVALIEKAKVRQVHRVTFTEVQVAQILATNRDPRDQIALRLLLYYGIRKGALRNITFDHFDAEKRRLTIFTKGEKIHVLPIVDDVVWYLLEQLDEPGNHYLLPKRKTRKRIPPRRAELKRTEAALAEAATALDAVSDDVACAIEAGFLAETLATASERLALTVEVASTQVHFVFTEPIGEHGAHLWWYRCLTRGGIVAPGTTAGRRDALGSPHVDPAGPRQEPEPQGRPDARRARHRRHHRRHLLRLGTAAARRNHAGRAAGVTAVAQESRAPAPGGRLRVMNIHQATDLYLAEAARQGKSPRTRDRYRRHFEKLGDMYPHYDVDEVTTVMIRRFLDRWQDAAPATSAQIISMLRAFFGWLAREGIVPADPTERLERPKLHRPEDQDHLTSLSSAEVRLMLSACESWPERLALHVLRSEREISGTYVTWLYVVRDAIDDAVKIGVTGTPYRRLSQLAIGNPRELEQIVTVPARRGLEGVLHQALAEHRVRGEWFRLDALVLVAIELLMSAEDFHKIERGTDEPIDYDLTFDVLASRANELLDLLAAAA